MSKLITVLFISTLSSTALANESFNSSKTVSKIESLTESRIDKHQDYMNQQLAKSIERKSDKIIMDTMNDLKALDIE